MRFPIPTFAPVLAVALVALPGCGTDDSEPVSPPEDFAITIEHADGSVPPPAHVEWRLEVDDTGQGTLEYVPDYPGGNVPTFRAQFDVEADARDELYAELHRRDLLRDLEPAADPPVGGDAVSATVTADGRTIEIPAWTDDGAPLAALQRRIRQLAPRKVWTDFERRRAAYAADRYGDAGA